MEDSTVKTSFRFPRDLLKLLKQACLDRGKNQTEAFIEALESWIENKGTSNAQNSSIPSTNRDSIAIQSANPFANLTAKEAAAALAIVDILRGPDELDARTVHLLIDRWRLKYGDPGLPRGVHRRKRA